MHTRTESIDSALTLRRNPLNIRAGDGSDLVLEPTEHNMAKNGCNVVIPSEDPTKAMAAEIVDETPQGVMEPCRDENDVVDSVETLGIGEPQSHTEPPVGSLLPNLKRASTGSDLAAELAPFSLSRKNTIVPRPTPPASHLQQFQSRSQPAYQPFYQHPNQSRANVQAPLGTSNQRATGTQQGPEYTAQTGPSRTPALVQRLRTIRQRMSKEDMPQIPETPDLMDEVGLPDNVLQMIAFSPDSPWLGSEIDGFESSDDEGVLTEPSSQFGDSPEYSSMDRSKSASPEMESLPEEPFRGPMESNNPAKKVPEPTPAVPLQAIEPNSATSETTEVEPKSKHRPTKSSVAEADPVTPEDRGRLFLQVNKLANLKGLPVDMSRHPRFSITLDNGLQTVTTAWMPLSAPSFRGEMQAKIGQEFELMVAKDLELVLTINVAMDAIHPPERPRFQAPVSAPKKAPSPPPSPKKGMRSLLSPKKHKVKASKDKQDLEAIKNQEEQLKRDRQHEVAMAEFRKRADIWRGITGPNGEFSRGYLFESHYEREIFGQARSYALPLYNEWTSVTTGGVGPPQQQPQHMCDLQVTMMFVPKLYGSEKLPVSMRESQRELVQARIERNRGFEGFLTQNGGDCNMWRRRWFTLTGGELVGHHEATRKRRMLVNMEDAVQILDKVSDDLWCIYEDRSFQITFHDGEAISFYADSKEERDAWIQALQVSLVHSTGQQRNWTDLVMERDT